MNSVGALAVLLALFGEEGQLFVNAGLHHGFGAWRLSWNRAVIDEVGRYELVY